MKKVILLFSIFTLLPFLSSCSRLEVAYTFADEFTASKVDDFFDLSSQQKKELKGLLKEDLNKTRLELFPEIAEQLRSLEKQFEKDSIDQETLQKDVAGVKSTFWKFASYYKNTSIQTVQKISPDQFKEFDEKVQESIADTRDIKDAQNKIRKRYRRNIEMWIGGINNDQRNSIDDFLAKSPYPFELQAQNKEHLLKQFQKARTNPEELNKFMTQYFENYEALRLPAYAQALDKYHQALIEFSWKTFWPTMNDKQKKNLKENLRVRAEQLEKLASKKM